jgi:hypothetical protein
MAPRKKVTRAKAPAAAKAAKRKAKPAKTRALSVKDAVMREELPAWSAITAAQHAQNGLLHAMLRWSPMSVIVSQQAAFWEGYTRSAKVDRPATPKRARSR